MKIIQHIVLLALSTLLFTSCDKMGENDQVSGFWQLVSVQNGSTTTDVTADKIYWGLQDGIISVRSSVVSFSTFEEKENCYELIGRYSKNGEHLYIEELFYHYDSHDEPIPSITEILKKYGLYNVPSIYSIKSKGTTITLLHETGALTLIKS